MKFIHLLLASFFVKITVSMPVFIEDITDSEGISTTVDETAAGVRIDLQFDDQAADFPIDVSFSNTTGEVDIHYNAAQISKNSSHSGRKPKQVMDILTTIGEKVYETVTGGHLSDFITWVKRTFGKSTKHFAENFSQDEASITGSEHTYNALRTYLMSQMKDSQRSLHQAQLRQNELEIKEISLLNENNVIGRQELVALNETNKGFGKQGAIMSNIEELEAKNYAVLTIISSYGLYIIGGIGLIGLIVVCAFIYAACKCSPMEV